MAFTERIGVNLLWLLPGVVGGSETYAIRTLEALRDHPPRGLDLVVFVNRLGAAEYSGLLENFETVVGPVSGSSRLLRVGAENTWLPAQIRRKRLAAIHYVGGTMPFVMPAHGILTVHDIQPLLMPENFSRTKLAFLRRALPYSVQRSDRIVTLSDAVKNTLVRELEADPDSVTVVPPGIDVNPVAPSAAEVVRRRYGLGKGPFFLYPAITYSHKNHAVLIRALRRTLDNGVEASLVLSGGSGPAEAEIATLCDALGLSDHVHRVGSVPADDLTGLYSQACALVYPSLFEGFGIAVLEAMVQGCPPIVAQSEALEEVAGSAGIVVEPENAEEWAAAMERFVTDDAFRDKCSQASTVRASTFTWKASVDALTQVYTEVADARSQVRS